MRGALAVLTVEIQLPNFRELALRDVVGWLCAEGCHYALFVGGD